MAFYSYNHFTSSRFKPFINPQFHWFGLKECNTIWRFHTIKSFWGWWEWEKVTIYLSVSDPSYAFELFWHNMFKCNFLFQWVSEQSNQLFNVDWYDALAVDSGTKLYFHVRKYQWYSMFPEFSFSDIGSSKLKTRIQIQYQNELVLIQLCELSLYMELFQYVPHPRYCMNYM